MATVSKYTLKDGSQRWRVRFAKPDGKHTDKRGFKTKREANQFAATVEVDKATGSFVPYQAGLVTVSEVGKLWRASLVSDSLSWRERKESIYFNHVMPTWGHVKVKDVTPAGVQAWVTQQHEGERPLAAKTIRHNLGVLQAVLDVAVSERRIMTNPAREKVRVPRTPVTEKVFLTVAQAHALGEEIPEFYKGFYWFLVASGARFGEAAALRPMDLLGGGLVRLRRAYSKAGQKSVLTDLKGHTLRTCRGRTVETSPGQSTRRAFVGGPSQGRATQTTQPRPLVGCCSQKVPRGRPNVPRTPRGAQPPPYRRVSAHFVRRKRAVGPATTRPPVRQHDIRPVRPPARARPGAGCGGYGLPTFRRTDWARIGHERSKGRTRSKK